MRNETIEQIKDKKAELSWLRLQIMCLEAEIEHLERKLPAEVRREMNGIITLYPVA